MPGNSRLASALLLLGCVSACSSAAGPPENVLLITLDTLRADRLGAYGYESASTPNLDRLAAEGARFELAVSQAPLTLPSHTSLFTGAHPARHGVRDNGTFVPKDIPTLAELASESGLETGAFVSAFVLDSKWGLDRGFDTYFDDFELSRFERVSLASVERKAETTVTAAIDWLGARRGRFFAWVHLFDPHAPYEPPEPFKSRFESRPYDGEIAYLDSQLGRLFEALEQTGLMDKTLVIVASDHGEGLGDHGELTHGMFVYDSTIHVPLILRSPGGRGRGRVVRETVGLIDLFPTVGEMLSLPIPESVDGRSLVPLLEGAPSAGEPFNRRALLAESFYPRLHYGWSEVLSLRAGGLKYIDTPRPELYDLNDDPDEKTNLFDERGEAASRMARALDERFAAAAGESAQEAVDPGVDPETARRLRALGYVGTSPPRSDRPRSELPDPKDRIELVQAISRADAMGARGALDDAIALLREVIDRDPDIVDGWVSLGTKLSSAGRFDEAIEAFEKSLELSPGYDLALTNLALAYKMAGRGQEARAAFEQVLASDTENRQAFFNLAEIAMEEGDYSAALGYAEQGLEAEPASALFSRLAGMALFYEGDLSSSLARLEEASRRDASLERVHYLRALVHEKRGELELAERAYLDELEHHPQHLQAGFNLAQLYGRQGRTMEQIGLLERVTELHPDFGTGFIQLAKAYRDTGLEEFRERAVNAARSGLELEPDSELAPLGFFVLAELLEQMGRAEEARRAFEQGRELAESRATR